MFDSSAIWDKVGYAINDDQAHAAHTAPMFMQLRSVPKVWNVYVAYLCWESQSIQFGKSRRFAKTKEKALKFLIMGMSRCTLKEVIMKLTCERWNGW
jgi:hypothetical protein